jgi:hypothetical protein
LLIFSKPKYPTSAFEAELSLCWIIARASVSADAVCPARADSNVSEPPTISPGRKATCVSSRNCPASIAS